MGRGDALYARLPVWAQHAACTGFGCYWRWLRLGPGYRRQVERYTRRERYTAAQWQAWQAPRLRALLSTAADAVPYYATQWTPAQKRIARGGRLDELPLLDKEPIRAMPTDFLRSDLRPRWPKTFHTSGSTGTPIASIWTIPEIREARAVREARSARWSGVSFDQPRATFSGRRVEPSPDSQGPFYRYNAAERQVYFSPYHVRPDTAEAYVHALRRHGITWMTGYAVSAYLLAQFILEQKLQVPSTLKAIVTTSEKLTPGMRHTMQEAFRCKVYEEYSTVETALFASECGHGRLHVSPDVGIVEILRPDGTACDPGEVGEVVTTCLFRQYQLFIRYRLGDLAAWDPDPCPCGCQMPVIAEVAGRVEDVVIAPDGRRLVRFHWVFLDQPHVREGQIVQEAIDRIRVRVVPAPGFGPADRQEIIHRFAQRLGQQVQVLVETVDALPRMKSGKLQAVVSQLREQGIVAAETTGVTELAALPQPAAPRAVEPWLPAN